MLIGIIINRIKEVNNIMNEFITIMIIIISGMEKNKIKIMNLKEGMIEIDIDRRKKKEEIRNKKER